MTQASSLIPDPQKATVGIGQHKFDELIRLVTDGLSSPHSRRAYTKALRDFMAWHTVQGRPPLSKAIVQISLNLGHSPIQVTKDYLGVTWTWLTRRVTGWGCGWSHNPLP